MPVGGGTGKDAYIRVIFDAEGENNVVAALRDQIAATSQLRRENQAARKDTSALRAEQKRTAQGATDLGRSFRNILLRTVAIIGVLRTLSAIRGAFDKLISTGLQYNETIETSTLAIASLITATSDLVDVNGEVLEGAQALDVAYQLAEDQIQKLRVAGIQTAATTQELADAFQQAVGAGLQTGLSLDQIRNFTVQLTQAAGALGVPYRQLNEEIRSILGGIIDQNTRIAKALGITNDQIKAAKEQGRLYEFLNEQFAAFNIAGERIVTTFAALKSNVQETIELLSGEAVRPLFDALRIKGLEQLSRIFDFDTAEIAAEFQPLITALQAFFNEVGNLATNLITGFVDGLAAAGTRADYLLEVATSIGSSLARIVQSVVTWFRNFGGIGDHLGGIAQVLDTIADVMEEVANSTSLWLGTLALAGAGTVGLLFSLFGPVGGVITLAIASIVAFTAKIDSLIVSERERLRGLTNSIEAMRRQDQAFIDQTKEIDRLTDTYEVLLQQLGEAEEGTEKYLNILKQVEDVEDALSQQGLAELIRAANGERDKTLVLLREEAEIRRLNLGLQVIELETARDKLIAEQEAAVLRAGQRFRPGSPAVETAQREARVGPEGRARTEAIQRYQNAIDANIRGIIELNGILDQNALVTSRNTDAQEDNADALRRVAEARRALFEAIISRDLARAEFEALRDLENSAISIAEYYDTIREARERATGKREKLLQEALASAQNEEERLRIQTQLVTLLGRDALSVLQEEQEELKKRNDLISEGQQAQERYYEIIGQEGQAAIISLTARYDELITKLQAEKRFDLAKFATNVRDLEIARAQFSDLTREIGFAEDALSRVQRETDLLLDVGAITQTEANQRLADGYRAIAAEIDGIRDSLEEIIRTSEDPQLVNRARELLTLFGEANVNVRLLTDDWARFQKSVREAAEDSLANYFADAFIEAENFGEALRNLGDIRSLLADIIQQVIQLTSRLLAMKIIESIPIFGGSTGGAVEPAGGYTGGYVRRYAGGGRVRGPGGPTADKVPALLSAGEYVIRAASVKKYGTDLLSKLNAGILPRGIPRFAGGGLVAATTGGQSLTRTDAAALRGELAVGLQDGLVLRDMSSPAGERLILKVINDNRRSVRSTLGGR